MKVLCLLSLVLLFCVSCHQSGNDSSCSTTPCVAEPSSDVETPKGPKQLWATSYLWAKAPELQAEEWISEKPDTKGKYLLIEHWNTWCPPCRRSIKLLNDWHNKYKDELVVIGITDEDPTAVQKMKEDYGIELECYSAVDTQKRQKEELGVFGVPHTIILEPNGYVVWEGFPYLKGYELTDAKIEKILAVGRKKKNK